jgi:hypothetical protein
MNDFVDNFNGQSGARPYLEKDGDTGEFVILNQPVERKIGGFSASLGRKSYLFSFLNYWASMVKQLRRRAKLERGGEKRNDPLENLLEGESPDRVPEMQHEAMRQMIGRIQELCRSNGIELAVIPFPELFAEYERSARFLSLEEICAELGIDFFDLPSRMREDRLRYFIGNGDIHWNEEGNRKGAELVFEYMRGKGPDPVRE